MTKLLTLKLLCMLVLLTTVVSAKEYHVSVNGSDNNNGSARKPFKTISAVAEIAQPGDVISVHEGVYRERINPPRGGQSDSKRITYQAAKGKKVVIKGSEIIKGWVKVKGDTWKVEIPNSFFGDFNPYRDKIRGDWFTDNGRVHHTGAVYLNGDWHTEAAALDSVMNPLNKTPYWFAKVDSTKNGNTTIWAQFKGVDPNEQLVEINVRQTVFYPEKPGRNYITVSGFTLEHAATPWAPPTAEQIGLIGTHWSKGWIIENNTIRYSICTGVTLGKYGDKWDNTSADSAHGYIKTIERAIKEAGWSKETIGHHIVHNNHISHCEQAGIVGSLGAIFSEITGNEIHDIHIRKLFKGFEMAGIKFHAPIDVLIANNHIHHTVGALWLDWMVQGTRVSRNLLHDNGYDLGLEANHGPFMIDNNLFLSGNSINDVSAGGCFAHNVFAGTINCAPNMALGRSTPYHPPHATNMVALYPVSTGDDRFYNNIFIGNSGLADYRKARFPLFVGGNIYLHGAKPYQGEKNSINLSKVDPNIKLITKDDGIYFQMTLPEAVSMRKLSIVTTEMLGKTKISKLQYENSDGTYLKLDRDYFGKKRDLNNPFPGPLAKPAGDKWSIKVWPRNAKGINPDISELK